MQRHEAILSLGSNQGDRLAALKQAGLELLALPETCAVAFSPVYETEPVGAPEGYGHLRFLNCVVILETGLSPEAFSQAIHAIEARLGRTRTAAAGLPRVIDLDILTFGDVLSDAPHLTLPHPRACGRRFVLQPLTDLRPGFVFPGQSQTVSELLRTLPPEPRVWRYE